MLQDPPFWFVTFANTGQSEMAPDDGLQVLRAS